MYLQQTVQQKIADLNKKTESLTKAKVEGDVEQALRNVRKAVARAPESFDPHLPLLSLEILVDAAKFGGHKDAQYYESCLRALRENLSDANVRTLLQKLVGSTEDSKVANITDKWKKAGKAVDKTLTPVTATPPPPVPTTLRPPLQYNPEVGCFGCGSPLHLVRNCPGRRRQTNWGRRRPYRGYGRGRGNLGANPY